MLKKGDIVVMHTCGEAEHYNGKLWACKTDEYINCEGQGVYEQKLVFLEGFSCSFLTKYLQKVDVTPYVEELSRLYDARYSEVSDQVEHCLVCNKKVDIEKDDFELDVEGGVWCKNCIGKKECDYCDEYMDKLRPSPFMGDSGMMCKQCWNLTKEEYAASQDEHIPDFEDYPHFK